MDIQTEVIISARCGAAARGGVNEDNCLIMTSVGNPTAPIDHLGNGEFLSEVVPLGRNGCLLVVADGMGGMNAGEVASQLAVKTIIGAFSSEKISSMDMTENNIHGFIRQAILDADKVIKEMGENNPEQEGMGTTIALMWIVDGQVYYGWCGDSRIYCYNNGTLSQLSSDHSYVCEILHLSEEDAFKHPENNIITRSLGNPEEDANPDVAGPEPLHPGDLFLLCSDGLCGVLRNSEILNDLQVAVTNPEKLNEGNLLLWEDAENHAWHDNVTSLLCYVKSCPQSTIKRNAEIAKTLDPNKPKENPDEDTPTPTQESHNESKSKLVLFALVVLGILIGVAYAVTHRDQKPSAAEEKPKQEQVIQKPDAEQQKTVQETGEKQDSENIDNQTNTSEKQQDAQSSNQPATNANQVASKNTPKESGGAKTTESQNNSGKK